MKTMLNGKQFTQGAAYQLGESRTMPECTGHSNPAINEIHHNANLTREEKLALGRQIWFIRRKV